MSLPTPPTALSAPAAGNEPDRRGAVRRPALRPAEAGLEARFLTSFFDELTGNLDGAGDRRSQGG